MRSWRLGEFQISPERVDNDPVRRCPLNLGVSRQLIPEVAGRAGVEVLSGIGHTSMLALPLAPVKGNYKIPRAARPWARTGPGTAKLSERGGGEEAETTDWRRSMSSHLMIRSNPS